MLSPGSKDIGRLVLKEAPQVLRSPNSQRPVSNSLSPGLMSLPGIPASCDTIARFGILGHTVGNS